MNDKKSQLTFLVSLGDNTGSQGDTSQRNAQGMDPLPYFCTKLNIPSAIAYLSQELMGLGLNCNLIDSGSQKVNLIGLVNACWEVMQLYRASIRDSNTLLDQRRRDASDLTHCQNSLKDLRGTVEEKERLVCDAQERERQAVTVNKALSSKIKSEKEEVRRLNSVLQQREAHHQHELRKKETENNRLRERLHRMVSGERQSESRPAGITISNTLSRSNRARAKWKTEATGVRHEEEMHRKVVSQYEAWVGQLSDENDQLKSCLSAVTSHISKIVTKFSKIENHINVDGDMNSSMFSCDSLEDPLFNLEFPAVREQVQQTLEDYLKVIVQLIEDRSKKDSEEKQECLQLKKEVEELQLHIARKTDQLISAKFVDDKGGSPEKEADLKFLEDGMFVEEMAILEKKKEELESEKKALQQERETFTNAAIRLNKERAAFEVEKVELLKRQFLQELPPTLTTSLDMSASCNESAGSLSSLGEFLNDSPQKTFAMPTLTPPRGNISFARMSTPIVLGPTSLPKQPRNLYSESPTRKSAYRLKSAPVSRASSIPRQDDFEGQPTSDKETGTIRPYCSRPNTLERRRKPKQAMSSLRYRSQSQNRLEYVKDSGPVDKMEYSVMQGKMKDDALLNVKTLENQEVQYPSRIASAESINHFPDAYRDDIFRFRANLRPNNANKRLTIPQSNYDGKHYQRDFYGQDMGEIRDPSLEESSKLKSLEADLLNLIAKIGQQHGESAVVSVDNPSDGEIAPKICKKPVAAALTAPGSLSSSRRSSRDFSCVDQQDRSHKRLIRK